MLHQVDLLHLELGFGIPITTVYGNAPSEVATCSHFWPQVHIWTKMDKSNLSPEFDGHAGEPEDKASWLVEDWAKYKPGYTCNSCHTNNTSSWANIHYSIVCRGTVHVLIVLQMRRAPVMSSFLLGLTKACWLAVRCTLVGCACIVCCFAVLANWMRIDEHLQQSCDVCTLI